MFITLKEIKELNVKAFQDSLENIGKPYKLGESSDLLISNMGILKDICIVRVDLVEEPGYRKYIFTLEKDIITESDLVGIQDWFIYSGWGINGNKLELTYKELWNVEGRFKAIVTETFNTTKTL